MSIFGVLAWIIFGGIVGWLASKIMDTDKEQGIVANVVIGIIGALLGGFLASMVGWSAPAAGFDIYSFLISLLGAILLLGIVKLFRGNPE